MQFYGGIHAKPVEHVHRALAKRFPFAIYYLLQANQITVIAVLDCRQNLASIVKRLKRR